MTEKEKVLASVIEHFMDKAEKDRKSKYNWVFVNAHIWDDAAIEVAGLGASSETIQKAIERYVSQAKISFLNFEYFKNAIKMAKKGASPETAESLLKLLLNNYFWVWAFNDIISLLKRDPTKEEIFSLVKLEQSDIDSYSPDLHDKLMKLSDKYLSKDDVKKVRNMLRNKVKKFNSMSN